jgi:tetratricopeptide (TPR) repeat protein
VESIHIENKHLLEKRLGETYAYFDYCEEAIKLYERAIELGGSRLECGELLATCLHAQGKATEAESKMDEVREHLDGEMSMGRDERLKAYIRLSKWYLANGQTKKALYCAEKAGSLSSDDHEVAICLLGTYLAMEDDDSAVTVLESVRKSSTKQEGTAVSEGFIEGLLTNRLFIRSFALLSSNATAFDFFLNKVDRVIDRMKSEGDESHVSLATCLKGVALYYFGSQTPVTCAQAIKYWKDCIQLYPLTLYPVTLLAAYYCEQARAQTQPELADAHLMSMTAIMEGQKDIWVLSVVKSCLGSYYITKNKPQNAKDTLRPMIEIVFEMLSNETDEDDWLAYSRLADILLRSGDSANILTAYSMILPELHTVSLAWLIDFDARATQTIKPEHLAVLEERVKTSTFISGIKTLLDEVNQNIKAADSTAKNVNGDQGSAATGSYEDLQAKLEIWAQIRTYESFTRWCDGCDRPWDFDNEMNMCVYCWDIAFCDGCLSKLKEGKLRPQGIATLVCKGDHEWIRMPAHSRERVLEALNGRVVVGGHIENGVRAGGETKTVGEWIAGLKEEWGFAPIETGDSRAGDGKNEEASSDMSQDEKDEDHCEDGSEGE